MTGSFQLNAVTILRASIEAIILFAIRESIEALLKAVKSFGGLRESGLLL